MHYSIPPCFTLFVLSLFKDEVITSAVGSTKQEFELQPKCYFSAPWLHHITHVVPWSSGTQQILQDMSSAWTSFNFFSLAFIFSFPHPAYYLITSLSSLLNFVACDQTIYIIPRSISEIKHLFKERKIDKNMKNSITLILFIVNLS